MAHTRLLGVYMEPCISCSRSVKGCRARDDIVGDKVYLVYAEYIIILLQCSSDGDIVCERITQLTDRLREKYDSEYHLYTTGIPLVRSITVTVLTSSRQRLFCEYNSATVITPKFRYLIFVQYRQPHLTRLGLQARIKCVDFDLHYGPPWTPLDNSGVNSGSTYVTL